MSDNIKYLIDKLHCSPSFKENLELYKTEIHHSSVSSDSLVGVELELENMTREGWEEFASENSSPELRDVPYYWNCIRDGSLREGCEFVSKPLNNVSLMTGIKAITALENYRNPRNNLPLCLGIRTSMHIHINVLDLSVEQFKNMVYLYAIFERCMFYCYAFSRIKNNFCKPIHNSQFLDQFKKLLLELQKETLRIKDSSSISRTRDISRQFNRYYALNVLSLFKHGTLEFRHFTATLDKDIILERINFIMQLKEISKKYSGLKLISAIENSEEDGKMVSLLSELFPLCPTFISSFESSEQRENLFLGVEDLKLKLSENTLNRLASIEEEKENINEFKKFFKGENK